MAAASQPTIIAHRGASGVRPEHTLEAYALAIDQGADYIEPDLVITKDGVLIARHENEISTTTNVADKLEFYGRRTTKTVDGERVTGWFTEDFTLAEIKTLRARESRPAMRTESAKFSNQFQIPTFEEVVKLAQSRGVGVYPETKHPTYFQRLRLPLEPPLIETLKKLGWNRRGAPVFIQSFEVGNLIRLRSQTPVRLVQLLSSSGQPWDIQSAGGSRTYRDMATPEGLREIAAYAQGVGVEKALVFPRNDKGEITEPSTLVRDAKAARLLVHVWTFRNEDAFLPANHKGDPAGELKRFFGAGVDGVFTDFVDTAAAVRRGSR